ncbi:MAG: transglutaminase domain-containing protein, partial [Alphaproteobacteria bacterium]|nr:transglutaminase domain-containing protein [Alphaproteobacteria bacterium]
GWMLWSLRPPAWRRRWFAASVLAASGLAAVLALVLQAVTPQVEQWAFQLLLQLGHTEPPATWTSTAMGRIGTLKLSDRIVLRVDAAGLPPGGLRLREASYRIFSQNSWFAGEDQAHDAEAIASSAGETGVTGWRLQTPEAGTVGTAPVTVTAWLGSERTVLPLPEGTTEIRALPARKLRSATLGTVTAEGLPVPVRFQAFAEPGHSFDRVPDDLDLLIPEAEKEVLNGIVAALGLSGRPPSAALAGIERYFDGNFRYSLTQAAPGGRTALAHFLQVSHQGHCEFFATATVLLLRAAGVPARYVTGYVAAERDPWEGDYRVRQRHAHAWTQAFVDGRWRTVDTTPARWAENEAATMPEWQVLPDLVAWVSYRYSRWRNGENGTAPANILSWLLIPGFLFLGWSMTSGLRRARPASLDPSHRTPTGIVPGSCAFDPIERHFASRSWVRPYWQPLLVWLHRLPATSIQDHAGLLDLAHRHYQATFDPESVVNAERQALSEDIVRWLKRQTI